MITVWAILYDTYGHQYGRMFKVKGENIYEEIKAMLRSTEDIADYGVCCEEPTIVRKV